MLGAVLAVEAVPKAFLRPILKQAAKRLKSRPGGESA
jgi:hypothetical protein